MNFSKKTICLVLTSVLFLLVSSYFIYQNAYIEPVVYDTYIEIYRNENDYKAYLKNDTSKKLVGYNLYKTIGLNLYGESIEDLTLNTSDNSLNGIVIHYKSDYYSYYNLDNELNLFKDLKLRFANWNKKYIATTKGLRGQFGINFDSIYDIDTEKKVLDNLSSLGQSKLYFLKSQDKNYFYIDSHTCEQINTLCNEINIYDNKGKIIYQTTNKNGFIVDFKEIPVNYNTTYEVEGYYEEQNNEYKKYDFNHQEIKSDLYDKILFVGMFNYVDYNIVYKEIDNSIYIIDKEEKVLKKIAEKISDNYCLVKTNESLHIYEEKCNEINNAKKYYNFNIRNHKVTEVEIESDIVNP